MAHRLDVTPIDFEGDELRTHQLKRKLTYKAGQEPASGSALESVVAVRGGIESQRAKFLKMSQRSAATPSPLPVNFVEHAGLRLHTAFQPIISVVHSKVVGHEALIRGETKEGEALSPAELFPQLVATLSARQVNETCSNLHLESFAKQSGDGWLFLNVSPDAMPDRAGVVREFGHWLASNNVEPHRVVVEIIETRAYDEILLADAVAGFRDLGCLVAIDDFGAGESNFERVWRLRPDIVKLDRAMITEAAVNPLVARILPGIVSLVHEAGCLVVMEGIETEEQALIAVESDVDFVQGYFFCRPSAQYQTSADIAHQFDQLAHQIKTTNKQRSEQDQGFFASYTSGLEACVSALEDKVGFEEACAMFVAVAGVQRVYQLDQQGYQIGENAESLGQSSADLRFLPCSEASGANWFRRPYFQRAIQSPGRVQVSRPYLSIRDARSCVTISMAFGDAGHLRVVCADLDYDQGEPAAQSQLRHSAIVRK